MKRIFTFLALAALTVSCSVDEANQLDTTIAEDTIVVEDLSKREFIQHLENRTIDAGLVSGPINPELSVFTPGILDIETFQGTRDLIDPGAFGRCQESEFVDANGNQFGELSIARLQDEDANVTDRTDYRFASEGPWYIYSVQMHIADDCGDIPLLPDGSGDTCNFNIRNCFGAGVTSVKYKFNTDNLDECVCTTAYVVFYRLNNQGCVAEVKAEYLAGTQLAGSTDVLTNSYCKTDCGADDRFDD